MKFILDTHCHTIASGHAYSTVQEIIQAAKSKGLKMVAITDHGPAMPGTCHIGHFWNMQVIPRTIEGVEVLRGVEANIIDYQGKLDMEEEVLKRLDIVIASLHELCIKGGSQEDHTKAVIGAMSNPYVDVIGHPGNPVYTLDIDAVMRAAKKNNVLIEINNSSFRVRMGSEENCTYIAKKAKEIGCKVIVGSDAHISYDVGRFDTVMEIFKKIDMPEELVMNTSSEKLRNYLKQKGKLL